MSKQRKAVTRKMVLEMDAACVCCAENTAKGLCGGVDNFTHEMIKLLDAILPDGLSRAVVEDHRDWLNPREVVAFLNKDQYPKTPVIRPEAFLDQLNLQGICVTKRDFYRWLRQEGYAKKAPYSDGCNLATGKSLLMGLFTDNTKAPYYGLRMTPAGVAYFAKTLISACLAAKNAPELW